MSFNFFFFVMNQSGERDSFVNETKRRIIDIFITRCIFELNYFTSSNSKDLRRKIVLKFFLHWKQFNFRLFTRMKYGWSVRISFSLEKEEIAKKFWELKSCAIKRAAYIVETIAKRFAPPLSFRVFRISDVVCVRDKTIAARPWNANAYRVVARVKPEVGTSVRSQRPRSLRVFRHFMLL